MRLRSLPLVALAACLVLTACAAEPSSPAESPGSEPTAPSNGSSDPDGDPDAPVSDGEDPAPGGGPSNGGDGGGEQPGGPTEDLAPPDLTVGVRLVEVARLGSAIDGAVGPDDRLYLADRRGTVHVLGADGAGPAVVDISSETTTDGERGLLGIAFAADRSELYVSFTDRRGDTAVVAYAVDDGEVDASQRRTVLTHEQPYRNHNGGGVRVGPDGMLYVALGDGGGGGDPLGAGQDRSTLLGKLLRIDPRGGDPYAVPIDNPFVGESGVAPEIWLWGLRNPWRFSFDRSTGELWVADVGQSSREEINRLPAGEGGGNLGWNLMEGTRSFSGDEPDDHVRPVHEYDTSSRRCSVTGGYVYRGQRIPELVGAYLFSDFCEGEVHAIVVDADGQVTDEASLGLDGGTVVSFAEDADGELYVLDLGGAVQRIEPVA